jgi:trypanothione synthetase/amidase
MLPYNAILGIASSNVPAYSNGDDNYFSNEPHYVRGVFTGYRWQCVEFARRWLLIRKTCTFRNIGSASDMWRDLTTIQRIPDGQELPLIAHANGSSSRPQKDSFIIYPRCRELPFGHVAVIVDVGPDYIRIAEQNYRFHRWSGNYARQITMEIKHGGYQLLDRFKINGWMEIAGHEQLRPLDDVAVATIHSKER